MTVVFAAAMVLFGIEFWSIAQLRREALELEAWDEADYLADAYNNGFDSDYERMERELVRFADELSYAV